MWPERRLHVLAEGRDGKPGEAIHTAAGAFDDTVSMLPPRYHYHTVLIPSAAMATSFVISVANSSTDCAASMRSHGSR